MAFVVGRWALVLSGASVRSTASSAALRASSRRSTISRPRTEYLGSPDVSIGWVVSSASSTAPPPETASLELVGTRCRRWSDAPAPGGAPAEQGPVDVESASPGAVEGSEPSCAAPW